MPEGLVPAGSTDGHTIYIWVGGPPIAGTERTAEVHDRMPEFSAALHAGDIEMSRVTVFARPRYFSRLFGSRLKPRLKLFLRS